ncbi:phospholipase [Gracilibacillus halophilus YIM-C55.5]|uniref:Phospholipase n=1 Tax=Gracilibacillus halophilus YIM-C55.5 TaxID=1308866 RepID=N4WAY4_9BACI|nr:patatin-like phospholipase family protein [Gracilibacillus halophilus]ENH97448.1 phospholipase [Gracilibacillus halophilus YIM-C55.5]
MQIDGVFSGGGVKAFVFIGALEALEDRGISFYRVAGTSAGALFATLVVAGYRSSQLKEMFLQLDLSTFLDQSRWGKYFPFIKWLTLYKTMGLYRGKAFETWLMKQLKRQGIHTFHDIMDHRLRIVAADITLSRIVVFPDDLDRYYHINPRHFSIAQAVRSSISIPYFFRPAKIINPLSKQRSLLVDGMISSNFPLWLFDQDDQVKNARPVLGMQLTDPKQYFAHKKVNNAVDLLKAMIDTMRKASDTRYISKNVANKILFFPVDEIDSTRFDLTREEKERLIDYGYQRTTSFLRQWLYNGTKQQI